mgnify:CR=1 FL=1
MSAEQDPNSRPIEPTTRSPPAESTPGGSPAPSASSSADGLFERVLVVTRDDEAGRAAAETALSIAAAHGATVDALYVVDTTEHWDMAVERHERTGEDLVEGVEARGDAIGVDVEKWFRYGTAHDEVLDFAAAHDADLIVVGSARRTGLDRLVRPDTLPVRVQRGADAPVITVGESDN